MHDIKMKQFLNGILNILNPGIAKFHYRVTFRTNQMIVLFVAVRFFVLRQVFSELMLTDQIAFDQ